MADIPSAHPVTSSASNLLFLVNTPTRARLFESIERHWQDNQGFAVATLNLDHIVKLRRSPDFVAAYQSHSHVVADGNPVVWLSHLAGRPLELVPGSELIEPLCMLAAKENIVVALIGATQETLDAAAEKLEENHPGLRINVRIAPPFGFDPESAESVSYLETVSESGAKLCFIALGAPKQERLAIKGNTVAPACGFVSIGAGLDFIAGSQTRAPKWMRKLAMEWVWRMLSNPRRLLLRYWRCLLVLPSLTVGAIRSRFNPPTQIK